MLSPLPLSSFERYMLADDRPEYPMTFFVRLHLDGVPERARLVRALRRVASRHPLLSAVVREVNGTPCWVPAVVEPRLEWAGAPAQAGGTEAGDNSVCGSRWTQRRGTAEHANRGTQNLECDRGRAPLDIRRESGLRVCVEAAQEQATLLLEFHHVTCDGIAAMQVVEDLLTAYAGEDQVPRPALRPVVPPLLRQRQRFATTWSDWLTAAGKFLIASRGLWEFAWNRPVPLATAGHVDGEDTGEEDNCPSAGPASINHRLSVTETRIFQGAARIEGGTVNDLLLTEWMGTLGDWQTRHGGRGRDVMRISMPVNMRRDADAELAAANAVSMVFLDRSVRRSRDRRRLGASLRFDTGWVKRCRLATVFLDAVTLLGWVPGALRRLLSGGRCLATAVLSNLGVQLDDLPMEYASGHVVAGDVRLSRLDFLPPVRPQTRVALGVVTYAGRLSLSMHYDRREVSVREARSLFASFVERIRRYAHDECPVQRLMASHYRDMPWAGNTAASLGLLTTDTADEQEQELAASNQ